MGVYRMVKGMVAHTIKEYRGRFLHELVQNGYDAHPVDAEDGKIAIYFDETEGHGVLYVANGGRPLTKSNFERMASLGESDKEIGVGIGNKGVGFKSVFQICDVPEVYSAQDLDDPGFSGYSFRFGTRDDLLDHLDGDTVLTDQLADDLSLSLLTTPLLDPPDGVRRFREDGYVTVLRLPANDARAAAEIRERITRLIDPAAPIMLFLERLSLLSIQTGAREHPRRLTRRVRQDDVGPGAATVLLNEATEYRVLTAAVPREALRGALRESVEEGALDERWLQWDTDAQVSVALGKNHAIADGRAFTFLPMGAGARSVLGGHINAPFVTNFARVDLDHEQPVNRLMVERIATLCLDAAAHLAQVEADGNHIVDLVSWTDRLDDLSKACRERFGSELLEFVKLPTRGGAWRSLADSNLWPWTDPRVIDETRVVAHTDANLLDRQKIDPTRMGAIADLAEGLHANLEPGQEVLAEWTESIAKAMLVERADIETWLTFYDDLKSLFSPDGIALRGKTILLTSSDTLAPCNQPAEAGGSGSRRRRRHRSVFFHPRKLADRDTEDDLADEVLPDAVTDAGSDVSVPASLEERIVFMHPRFDWNPLGPNRDGRSFLEDAHLVQTFRTEPLLRLLGHVLESSSSQRTKRDALGFAFRLMGSEPRRYARDLSNVGLQVPNSQGAWIPASEALFAESWNVEGSAQISALARGASESTPELQALSERLLAAPADLPARDGSVDCEPWIAFLRVLGVKAALPVLRVEDPRSIKGRYLTTARLLDGNDAPDTVPADVRDQWRAGLSLSGNFHHPETFFSTSDPICWFAGQAEVESLPSRLRLEYALLVIRTLPTLQLLDWSSTWRRKHAGGWDTECATALACFVREAPWLPVGSSDGAHRFRPPHDSWYIGVEDQMATSYSPSLDPQVRRSITGLPDVRATLQRNGLRVWGTPAHANALVDHLHRLFDGRDLGQASIDHIRSVLSQAWHQIGSDTSAKPPGLQYGLLVERIGQVELLAPETAGGERIVVMSTSDQSTASKLIRELGWPVVSVDTTDEDAMAHVRDTLRETWDNDVVMASEWEIEVMADDTPWEPHPDHVRLVDEVPWLPLLVACTMRYPRSGQRGGKQLERHIEDLERIRITQCRRISLVSATGPEPLPRRLRGTLPVPGPVPTLLVEGINGGFRREHLGKLAEAALELIGQSRFTADVALNVSRLAGDPNASLHEPDTEELADALEVSRVQVAEIEDRISGAVSGLLARLAPNVAALWGSAALGTLNSADVASRDGLVAVLTEVCGGREAAELLVARAADAPDADALRVAMSVDLAVFNAALARDFPAQPPIDYSARHLEEFNLRLSQRREDLLAWIRLSRLPRFDALQAQRDLPGFRALAFLSPDASWGTSMDVLPTATMDDRIDSVMTQLFGQSEAGSAACLRPWSEVRGANGHALRERLESLGRLIRAWHRKHDALTVPQWASAEEFAEDALRTLDLNGVLDFFPLDDDTLLLWLVQLDCWPHAMAVAAEPDALGLGGDDLDEAAGEQEAAREAKLRQDRQVSVHGEVMDLDISLRNLVQRISDHLATEPTSLDTPYRIIAPRHILPRVRGTRSGTDGRPPSGGGRRQRMSDAQRDAVGLAGELTAFHWLRAKDPSPVDETCWKSTYVSLVFQGMQGRDDLGYDFAVPRADGPVMYEVKSTTGECGMIELGETEVACAQEHAHGRGRKWRLLIVEEVLSTEPRVLVLPNPFHRETRSLFRFEGNSLRLRFKI